MNTTVSSSEFKSNMGRYLKQLQDTDVPIDITKNGKVVATVTPPKKEDKLAKLLSLQGVIQDEGQTKRSIREERASGRYESAD